MDRSLLHSHEHHGELSEKEQKWIEEQETWHKEHEGHDMMHAEMLLILMGALFLSQIGLITWKHKHPRSYNLISLIGLWFIPFCVSIYHGYWRFVGCWLLFSLVTGHVIRLARCKPLGGKTPRLVYKWFQFLYNSSYGFGIASYMIMMCTLFGLHLIFTDQPEQVIDFAIILFFYGGYFGVLGRDLAELAAEEMASTIGYYDKDSISSRALELNICAVCGQSTSPPTADTKNDLEPSYKLSCGHVFHDYCIRGWCIIGKKQICPYCKEKVDLQRMFSAPWEKPHVLYGRLLDWIRYLIVWHPAIIMGAQGINDYLGLK